MTKPKVFISSTIYDFSDLRSSMKYYLESIGYEVLLSEYNDFEKDLDLNTYDACLKTIENCQYFILLVGSRVGGFYNKELKISITQMEYRKAYNQLLVGKIKIINIVRENLWLVKNERKKIENILINEFKLKHDFTDEDIKKIKNYRSDIINNAEFTFNFIDEIARVKDMKSEKIPNQLPIGNWVHSFKTFTDVVDILRREFGFSKPLEDLALIENLKYEIIENLKHFFLKIEDKVFPKSAYAKSVSRNFKGNHVGESSFSKNDFGLFNLFIISGIGFGQWLSTDFIDFTIKSGKFLQHNYESGNLEQSALTRALLKLKSYIDDLKFIESMQPINSEGRIVLADKFKTDQQFYTINNTILYSLLLIQAKQKMIVNLSYLIFLDMQGDFRLLDDYPFDESGPSKEIDEALEKEKVTTSDLMNYFRKTNK